MKVPYSTSVNCPYCGLEHKVDELGAKSYRIFKQCAYQVPNMATRKNRHPGCKEIGCGKLFALHFVIDVSHTVYKLEEAEAEVE